jgi:uncharacterized protein (DUF58 family)
MAGSRPYRPGDDVRAIDWAASARLSAARQSAEFVVRERYAEEAPRVVIVCDRRPGMAAFGSPLPWLDKAVAMRHAAELIIESALIVGGFVGYLDFGSGSSYWVPPRGGRRLAELRQDRLPSDEFFAPPDSLELTLQHLAEHRRSVTSGSFVFVLSDFLPLPTEEVWLAALEHRWDLIPVVIQDPVWEQSFPDVSGIVVPLREPGSRRRVPVRLRRKEVEQRRLENRERLQALLAGFEAIDIEPVLVSTADRGGILAAFLDWAEARRVRRAA